MANPTCTRPPAGWCCTRAAGHAGPCAAWPEGSAALPVGTATPAPTRPDLLDTSGAPAAAEPAANASNLVPGQMHCARCKFQLTRTILYLGNGAVGAGDSKTERCPNGCGPLWPVTWEQAARDAWATCETLFERAKAAEDALAAVNPPRLAPPSPAQMEPSALHTFYGVSTDAELIAAQARHIEKLQAKLPGAPSFAPMRVREG